MDAIKTFNISKSYKAKKVLDDVSITVREGEIYGLVGGNGAGKTTLMRIILGIAAQNEGTVQIFENSDLSAERRKIGALIEAPALNKNLSAFDNMKIAAEALGVHNDAQLRRLLERMDLDSAGNKRVGSYSLGMKQRLGLAMAMIGNPRLLVLDEPVNGLDPTGIVEIRELIRELNSKYGVTVLISSHLLSELQKLATAYGVLRQGRLVKEMREDEIVLLARPYVKLTVTDCPRAMSVLKGSGFDALAFSVNTVHVQGADVDVARLIMLLAESGVGILGVEQCEGDLEAEFISLMGGISHESI